MARRALGGFTNCTPEEVKSVTDNVERIVSPGQKLSRPPVEIQERTTAQVEGWILGVM